MNSASSRKLPRLNSDPTGAGGYNNTGPDNKDYDNGGGQTFSKGGLGSKFRSFSRRSSSPEHENRDNRGRDHVREVGYNKYNNHRDYKNYNSRQKDLRDSDRDRDRSPRDRKSWENKDKSREKDGLEGGRGRIGGANVSCDWTEHRSSSGKKYYYNSQTEVSQWEKPQELVEAEKAKQALVSIVLAS